VLVCRRLCVTRGGGALLWVVFFKVPAGLAQWAALAVKPDAAAAAGGLHQFDVPPVVTVVLLVPNAVDTDPLAAIYDDAFRPADVLETVVLYLR